MSTQRLQGTWLESGGKAFLKQVRTVWVEFANEKMDVVKIRADWRLFSNISMAAPAG